MVFTKGWKKKKEEPKDEIAELERVEQEARKRREELQKRSPHLEDAGVVQVEVGSAKAPISPKEMESPREEKVMELNPDVKSVLEEWQKDYQATLSSGIPSIDYAQRDTTNTLLLMIIMELRRLNDGKP